MQRKMSRMAPHRIAALASAALIACAHSPLTPPSRGGAAWISVGSRHFELLTDQSQSRARALSSELERIEAAFEDLTDFAFAQRPPPPGRVTVVAFAREADYQAIVASRGMPHADALFTSDMHELENTPTIMMHGDLDSGTRETLQHELTHRFIRFHLRDVPVWLNEGLAQYFSTLDLADGNAYFGRLPKSLDPFFNPGARIGVGRADKLHWLTVEDLPPLASLLAAGPAEFYAHDENNTAATVPLAYPASWVLVHMLSSSSQHHAERLREFIAHLADGVPRGEAFRRAFAGIPLDELERQYRRYALAVTQSGQTGAKGDRWLVLERTRYQPRDAAPVDETHPLDDLTVRLLFVRLLGWSHKSVLYVWRELDAARDLHPDDPEVHFLRGLVMIGEYHNFEQAELELRAAVTARPKETRFWLGLVHARMARATELGALAQKLEPLEDDVRNLARRARSASALNSVGWYYALRETPAVGMPFALRAVAADASCAECFDTLALLQSESGMVNEAIASQQRACDLVAETAEARGFAQRLNAYKQAAAAPH
jgi:hypothetical protein